jgi:hypothetical protein
MMRAALMILLACCLAGCVTKEPKPSHPAPVVGEPKLSPEQIVTLKGRLDKLRVGMGRDQVMEILDLSSLNVRSWADSSSSGVTYNFGNGHSLTVALDKGDYTSTLRWAKFDGELWPKQ